MGYSSKECAIKSHMHTGTHTHTLTLQQSTHNTLHSLHDLSKTLFAQMRTSNHPWVQQRSNIPINKPQYLLHAHTRIGGKHIAINASPNDCSYDKKQRPNDNIHINLDRNNQRHLTLLILLRGISVLLMMHHANILESYKGGGLGHLYEHHNYMWIVYYKKFGITLKQHLPLMTILLLQHKTTISGHAFFLITVKSQSFFQSQIIMGQFTLALFTH